MKKKRAVNEIFNIAAIRTPRQLAKRYSDDSARLENLFVKHRLIFFKTLKDVPFKKEKDAFHAAMARQIVKSVKAKLLPLNIKAIAKESDRICLALYDFASAIQAFQTVITFVREHNKMFAREKKKALGYLNKLCENPTVRVPNKKKLEKIKEDIIQIPSEKGGDYFPLYFLDFLHDLGYKPGENIAGATLQQKLEGLFVAINVRLPKNRPGDLFLLNALQIVIYELLNQSITINRYRRYQRQASTRNRDAENMTAQIINAYIKKTGLKGLPRLAGKTVYTTLYRNPA